MSTTITIQGNVTKKPELRATGSGTPTCTISVAVNRKVPSRNNGGFVESVSYFSVIAYQQLAVNVCETLIVGNRVVVTGRLDQRSWENAAGQKQTTYELVADDIGASLRWATGRLTKTVASVPAVVEHPALPNFARSASADIAAECHPTESVSA